MRNALLQVRLLTKDLDRRTDQLGRGADPTLSQDGDARPEVVLLEGLAAVSEVQDRIDDVGDLRPGLAFSENAGGPVPHVRRGLVPLVPIGIEAERAGPLFELAEERAVFSDDQPEEHRARQPAGELGNQITGSTFDEFVDQLVGDAADRSLQPHQGVGCEKRVHVVAVDALTGRVGLNRHEVGQDLGTGWGNETPCADENVCQSWVTCRTSS